MGALDFEHPASIGALFRSYRYRYGYRTGTVTDTSHRCCIGNSYCNKNIFIARLPVTVTVTVTAHSSFPNTFLHLPHPVTKEDEMKTKLFNPKSTASLSGVNDGLEC